MANIRELRRQAEIMRYMPEEIIRRRRQAEIVSRLRQNDRPSNGVGTKLKGLLSWFGVEDDSTCGCAQHAFIMDVLGISWCKKHKDTIILWLKTAAHKKGLPFIESVARVTLDIAIFMAEDKPEIKHRVVFIGYPGTMGGANTECLHLLDLWRQNGVEIDIVPTWGSDPAMEAQLTEMGIATHHISKEDIAKSGIIDNAITVGMCNYHYMDIAPVLKEKGAKLIWLNCMSYLFAHERRFFNAHGMDNVIMVYQSQYQRDCIEPALSGYSGFDPSRGRLIRGAFQPQKWPFQPLERLPGAELRVGRCARPDGSKWPSNTWAVLGQIEYRPLRGVLMGAERTKVGKPPEWGQILNPNEIPAIDFIKSLHIFPTWNDTAHENWPRVGLEAMALGVPVIAPNMYGWKEMIKHSETGFLFDDIEELPKYCDYLARNEDIRLRIAKNAREHLESTLANPLYLWAQWKEIFDLCL